jgi:hypothetical protein
MDLSEKDWKVEFKGNRILSTFSVNSDNTIARTQRPGAHFLYPFGGYLEIAVIMSVAGSVSSVDQMHLYISSSFVGLPNGFANPASVMMSIVKNAAFRAISIGLSFCLWRCIWSG